jgi:DNA invertase Pin-like site-specific DNA recombinase
MNKYVAYYRVSTMKQGISGLGLEAQARTIKNHVELSKGEIVASFTDIKSGKDRDREGLQKALRECRLTGATLIVANVTRLARETKTLIEIRDSSVNAICCDIPNAGKFVFGMYANMAEYERDLISERTKAALQAAKARGVTLGNPTLDLVRNTDTTAARAALVSRAKARNNELQQVISEIKGDTDNELTLREIAEKLNEAGYTTSRGGQFHATSVNRILAA